MIQWGYHCEIHRWRVPAPDRYIVGGGPQWAEGEHAGVAVGSLMSLEEHAVMAPSGTVSFSIEYGEDE